MNHCMNTGTTWNTPMLSEQFLQWGEHVFKSYIICKPIPVTLVNSVNHLPNKPGFPTTLLTGLHLPSSGFPWLDACVALRCSSQICQILERGSCYTGYTWLPSGKHTKNYGKIMKDPPFLMGKSTNLTKWPCSIAMLYVCLPEGIPNRWLISPSEGTTSLQLSLARRRSEYPSLGECRMKLQRTW